MPIFESGCEECELITEWMGHFDADEPFCPECGKQMRRLPSKFRVVWTGPLSSKYNDSKLPGAHLEGHWAYKLRNTRDGKPEKVWIDTWQKRKEYMKSEGLVGIEDTGRIEPRDTGKFAGKDIVIPEDTNRPTE